MSVRREDDRIILGGDCPVEDAETLLRLLSETGLSVDVSSCGRLHAAVAQLLLAARPRILGTPVNSFAAQWILPHVLDERAENTSTRTIDSNPSIDSSPPE